jgi:hypothetical protein
MSSSAVRALFNTELAAVASANGFVFYDTINRAENPHDSLWISAEYYTDYVSQECYSGYQSVEHGTVDVSVFIKAGIGDNNAVDFADILITYFRAWHKGALEITDFVSASDIGSGDAESRWYGVSISLEYEFRF